MANRVAPKLLSTNHDTYQYYQDQCDYKHYHPQLFLSKRGNYHPNKGTLVFFHDYRRSQISDSTLNNNLSTLTTPIRPTWISDKPDRVLGRRKFNRESLFPVIQNNPVYLLSNRIPDRERDRDNKHVAGTKLHRDKYRDLTGSLRTPSHYFYHPSGSNQTFTQRIKPPGSIWEFPSYHRAAEEYTYKLERSEPVVKHMETDVK